LATPQHERDTRGYIAAGPASGSPAKKIAPRLAPAPASCLGSIMTLSLAGRSIESSGGISEAGRLVLRFIDGGTQWLQWAIANPNARYQFADENALVAGIQAGLHGAPFALLAKTALIVGPVKLMTLAPADLQALAEAEAGSESVKVKARVARILADHGLVTQPGLAAGAAFLDRLGIADAPVFQCPSLDDRLAILDLMNDPGAGTSAPSGPDREAAAFAAGRAATPLEFADYYRAWQCLAAAAGPEGTAEAKGTLVGSAIDSLMPRLFTALDCPRVDGGASSQAVAAAIDEWLMMGRRLGFARLSLGVQQVIANSDFSGATGDGGQQVVDAYLDAAQALLRARPIAEGRLGQDGMSRSFRVEGDGGEAIVQLDADGAIALAGFRPPPKS